MIRHLGANVVLLNNAVRPSGEGDHPVSINVIQPALQQLESLADLPPEAAVCEATPLLAALIRSIDTTQARSALGVHAEHNEPEHQGQPREAGGDRYGGKRESRKSLMRKSDICAG